MTLTTKVLLMISATFFCLGMVGRVQYSRTAADNRDLAYKVAVLQQEIKTKTPIWMKEVREEQTKLRNRLRFLLAERNRLFGLKVGDGKVVEMDGDG